MSALPTHPIWERELPGFKPENIRTTLIILGASVFGLDAENLRFQIGTSKLLAARTIFVVNGKVSVQTTPKIENQRFQP